MSLPSSTSYQVIARRYRPQNFSDVIGQSAVVTTLKNAIKSGKIAHAYLFCGCRGTGKTTLARIFSKTLNCKALSEDLEPCNACESCISITHSRSLDVMEIDGASHRGIDDIRQINETIGYAPSIGKYKIYIIDEVHMLTKEAFNALLKTLEEPPANVKFFFATTEPHKVLPTILSRCQRFDLKRISTEMIASKLKKVADELNVHCEEDAVLMVAQSSEGSMRDAESLFDQVLCFNEETLTAEKVLSALGLVSSSQLFDLDAAYEKQDMSYPFTAIDSLFSSGKDLSHYLDSLLDHYRNIVKVQLANTSDILPTYKEQYIHSAKNIYTPSSALYIIDYLVQFLQQIGKSQCKKVHLEMLLLHIIRSKNKVSIDTLIKTVHDLQQKLQGDLPFKKEETALPSPSPKIEEKAQEANTSIPPQKELTDKEEKKPLPTQKTIATARQETIIRFAAVELEGVYTKS